MDADFDFSRVEVDLVNDVHLLDINPETLTIAKLRSILGEEVSLGETEVINWIRDYLDEQYSSLNPKIEN